MTSFAFLHIKTLLKRCLLIKERNGNKFFPFRVDLFSEGMQNNFDRVTSPERVSTLSLIRSCKFRAHHSTSIQVTLQESLLCNIDKIMKD